MRNDIANRLQLTADERKQFDKVCEQFGPKIEKQKGELKQVWQNEQAAVEKVFTDPQRQKFHEMMKLGEKR